MEPLRLVGLAMGSGVAFGLAVVSLTVLGVDFLRTPSPAATPQTGAPLYLLFFGTLTALVAAGLLTWRLLAPILSLYRRGGLSVVSGLATVLAMLLCIPVHQLAGRAGLASLAVMAALASLFLARRTRLPETA